MRTLVIGLAAVFALAACSGERAVVVDNTLPSTPVPSATLPPITSAKPVTTAAATTSPPTGAGSTTTTGPTTTVKGTPTTGKDTTTTPTVLGSSIVRPTATTVVPSGCASFGTLATVSYHLADAPSGLVGTDIRAGAHDCYDRVVIEFGPHGPGSTFPGYEVGYTTNPVQGTGGTPVVMRGGAVLRVRVSAWMPNPDSSGYAGPLDITGTTTTHLREIRQIENFEAVSVWAIGIDQARPVRVTRLDSPARLVVDIFTG